MEHERIYAVLTKCLDDIEHSLSAAKIRHSTPVLAKRYVNNVKAQGKVLQSTVKNYFGKLKDDNLVTRTFRHEVGNHIHGFESLYDAFFDEGVENADPNDIADYVSHLEPVVEINRNLSEALSGKLVFLNLGEIVEISDSQFL